MEDIWEATPYIVVRLIKQATAPFNAIKQALAELGTASAKDCVFYHPDQHTAWAVLDSEPSSAVAGRWKEALAAAPGVTNVRVEVQQQPADITEWLLVKHSNVLPAIGNAWRGAHKMLGATPLATSIVNGLLGGAAGYGTGFLLERLFPDRYVERGKLRRNLALLGGGIGAGSGLWQGKAQAQQDAIGLRAGALSQQEQAANRTAPAAEQPIGFFRSMITPGSAVHWPGTEKQSRFFELARQVTEHVSGESYEKLASAGGLFLRPVPVDAFNRAVWNDVRKGVASARYNPFGSKDPWGDNDQALHTPPAVGAAATGLMTGLAEQRGSRMLTPADMIGGMVSAGVGLATANVAGRVLGALGGLTPPAQQKLQDMGAWAGLLTPVTRSIFQ